MSGERVVWSVKTNIPFFHRDMRSENFAEVQDWVLRKIGELIDEPHSEETTYSLRTGCYVVRREVVEWIR